MKKIRLKKENVLGRDNMVKNMNYIINSIEKLSNVNDNLTRINDILYELEKQLGPLKSQAERPPTQRQILNTANSFFI